MQIYQAEAIMDSTVLHVFHTKCYISTCLFESVKWEAWITIPHWDKPCQLMSVSLALKHFSLLTQVFHHCAEYF